MKIADLTAGRIQKIHQVLRGCRNPTQNAHDELEVNRRFDDAGLDQKRQVVDHAHIVDFEFGFGSRGGEHFQELAHGFKGIWENKVIGGFQVGLFPVKPVILDLVGDMKEGKIKGTGVEGGQFGLQGVGHPHPLFHRFAQPAARGGAQDDIAVLYY